jgi:bidirectional [NiFe] hydrogenase diaphorase subunit
MTRSGSRFTPPIGTGARRRCGAGWPKMRTSDGSGRTLTVIMNGRTLRARAGETILELARRSGVAIPSLCWVEGLSVWGGCRLCLVQVNGAERPVPSCGTQVTDGMQIVTDSDELREHRRSVVELHLGEGNHICSVCVANGECELQAAARELDVDHVPLGYRWPRFAVDATHERFVFDPNRCILCTRCVRVCAEVEGAHVWQILSRDGTSVVSPGVGTAWAEATACTSCGKCVAVCPTGALFAKGTAVGERHHDPAMVAALLEGRGRAEPSGATA